MDTKTIANFLQFYLMWNAPHVADYRLLICLLNILSWQYTVSDYVIIMAIILRHLKFLRPLS